MFCVIQEIETKKPNKYGHPKSLKSEYMQASFNGQDLGHYYYSYSNERFERAIKKAYRISVHQSYRENGQVKKKQFVLCTVNYYDFAQGYFSLYDYCDRAIGRAADALGVESECIYALVENKVNPPQERIW